MSVKNSIKAEILCIGTELLLGNIVNGNAKWLSEELAALGLNHLQQSVIGDNLNNIKSFVIEASKRCNLLITTGGLGPTPDDLTKEGIALAFKSNLYEIEEVLIDIRKKFHSSLTDIPKSNYKQALFPKEAKLIPNKTGTAPGMIWSPVNDFTIISFPGVPSEMKEMWAHSARNWIKDNFSKEGIITSKTLKFSGISESLLAEKVNDLLASHNPTIAPYASLGEVKLRLTAKAKDIDSAKQLIEPFEKEIIKRTGTKYFSCNDEGLAHKVINLLNARKETISIAESCTGGKLGSYLTAVPGVSSIFFGGVIAYSNYTKQKILGVKEELIETHGAVSREVVEAMAQGIKEKLSTDWGIAISGVAGPTGATRDKPIGFVEFGFAGPNITKSLSINFGSHRSRIEIQELSVVRALNELRLILLNQS